MKLMYQVTAQPSAVQIPFHPTLASHHTKLVFDTAAYTVIFKGDG